MKDDGILDLCRGQSQQKWTLALANLPIYEIWDFREKNKDELEHARRRINQLSRSIKEKPLSDDFENELSAQVGKIYNEMQALENTRNGWINSRKIKLAGTGLSTIGAALSFLLSASPVAVPLMLIAGAFSLVGEAVFPVLETLFERQESKAENRLHYFVRLNALQG
jgi:hypothetical protein